MKNKLLQKWLTVKDLISRISTHDEQSIRMVHYSAFLICSIPTMIVFGLIGIFNANYLLSFLILISALGLLIGLIMLYRVKNGKIIYRLNMLFFLILILYMIYMGGEGGSKSLWTFVFSLIAFFLLGLKEGCLWCIGAFILLVCLFWNPLGFENIYPYAFSFKIRFLISYVIISFVTSWFEYFRSHYQQDLKMKNQALEEERQQLTQEIQERKRLEKDLKIMANTDALTGIMNRRYFWQQTNSEIQRHFRYGHSMALLMLDIDLFKTINDTHGHPAGDLVIQLLAKILMESVRKIDLVGRLGGEEFGVLLIETPHENVLETAQRLRKNIMDASIEYNACVIDFTASIGVALARPSEDTVETLVARADRALYLAKENGRNRVELYRGEI